jgi:hypothetical protein
LGSTLTSVITARTTRNRALYAADTGVVNIAQNSKVYVKAAFGATSAEYKSVSGIKFTKPAGTDI